MLHPELALLQQRYNEVLDEHEAGHLSYDDALMSVQAMSVLDGAGFVWMIDPVSGAFLRAVPGEQPVEADPSQFAAAQIPAAGSAPWASQQDLLRPPARPGAGAPASREYPQQYDPGYQPGFDTARDPRGGYGHDDIEYDDPRSARRTAVPARGQHPYGTQFDGGPRQTSKRSGAALLDKFRNLPLPAPVQRHRKLVGIVAVLAVVLLVAVSRGGDAPPTAVTPTPTPTESTVPTPTESTTPAPVEPTPTTAQPVDPTIPSVDQRGAVFAALVSGDRGQVVAALADPGDAKRVAMMTAHFYGYAATNLTIAYDQEPVKRDNGRIVSEVSLVDRASGTVYASTNAVWTTAADGRWVLATYPSFE